MAAPDETEPFVSREGRFAAAFPDTPVQESSGRSTWAGRMEAGSYELEGGGLRLRVEFHDVPKMAAAILPPQVLLDLAKDSLVEDVRASDVESAPVTLHAHPGVSLRYRHGDHPGVIEEARIFLVGARLYVTFARADEPGEKEALASRFLASFDAWEPRDAVASAVGGPGAGL